MEGEETKFKVEQGHEGRKQSKNSKIKAALFKNKKKGGKTEDEGQEVKRLKKCIANNEVPESASIKKFMDLPLSRKTLWGLKEAGFVKPTEVQRESLGLALRGLDILGAAKTGSGKTLAFIIPVLEKLYLNLWTPQDGLGALIITPTRELAYQIYETLRVVGKKHDFSAGLVIGGKDIKFERKRVDQLNIIICTPGRLLQHMDENPQFCCDNLQILVLDEADRCLDMGFERDMNAIVENLPPHRQTLLFSATQTKSLKDLARLSLKSPVYVSVHENATHSTPESLQQSYIVCPLESKVDMLWSFLKHHKKSKILVFLSTCKQVRFINLLFCRMRPGTSVLALYGSLHQLKRMAVYDDFCKKQSAVLFATDIAARGLDFPAVDWVVQLDCPEDATTYIHRAGRTARYNSGGEALLVLLPSEEEAMAGHLEQRKIPIQKIEVNQKRCTSVRKKFNALLARDINLKECAQRAFKSYVKSVFLMKDKTVFNAGQLDLDGYASSLGLIVAPRVRFLEKTQKKLKNSSAGENSEEDDDASNSDADTLATTTRLPSFSSNSGSKTLDFSIPDDDSEDDMTTLFKSKKPVHFDDNEELSEDSVPLPKPNESIKKAKSKAAVAKKLMKKNINVNKKAAFDDEGGLIPDIRKERQSMKAKNYENQEVSGIDIALAKEILKEEDQYDKQIFRERIRAKHREERLKKRLARKGLSKEDEEDAKVVVGNDYDSDKGSSDEGEGPNLDWLPDPDEIYGPAKDGDESDEETTTQATLPSESESDDEDESHNRKKLIKSKVASKKKAPQFTPGHEPKRRKLNGRRKGSGNEIHKDLLEELALKLLSR